MPQKNRMIIRKSFSTILNLSIGIDLGILFDSIRKNSEIKNYDLFGANVLDEKNLTAFTSPAW